MSAKPRRVSRARLLRRLNDLAEIQIAAIEARPSSAQAGTAAERERDARTLAALLRSLREIGRLGAERPAKTAPAPATAASDPRALAEEPLDEHELEALRQALARRFDLVS